MLGQSRAIPDASTRLKTACLELFGDRGASAAKVKALALATAASSKKDQVRAAETRAALDWLYGCLISENGAGNGKRLSQSEDLAMRELQRPLRSAIDAQTHAKARYVLAVIGHMRCETEVCASNVAHMAAVAPRWFRAELPAMFEQVFRSECQAAYDRLEAETEGASNKSYRGRIIAQRVAAVAVGIGVGAAVTVVVVGGMFLIGVKGGANPGASAWARKVVMGVAKPIWTSATRENAKIADLARIRSRFEARLDEECRVIAQRIL